MGLFRKRRKRKEYRGPVVYIAKVALPDAPPGTIPIIFTIQHPGDRVEYHMTIKDARRVSEILLLAVDKYTSQHAEDTPSDPKKEIS